MAADETILGGLSPDALALVADRFRVLGEPLRLRILQLLLEGERSVMELAGALGTSQPNVSKHLRRMQDAGLVRRRQEKNLAWYSIADDSVVELCELVCRHLGGQLERRARALRTGAGRADDHS